MPEGDNEVTPTTTKVTTTTTKAPEPKMFLWEFLDFAGLSRGEKLYYTKHFDKKPGEKKTQTDWTEITKLKIKNN